MSMDAVKALMKEVGWGCLATSDGEKVGVRPMGGLAWIGAELWCASGTPTDKVSQLEKVPHAEYCFAAPDGRLVRIAGECTVSTDDDMKQKLYDAVPGIHDHVEGPTAPSWVVLVMKPDCIRITKPDMSYEEVTPE